MLKYIIFFMFIFMVLLFAVPSEINYQGKLVDPSGVAIDGVVNLTFSFFASEMSADTLWQETHVGVSVEKGLFDVILGSVTSFPDSLNFSNQYWLEIAVNGEALSPRISLTSVPYCFRAAVADSLAGGFTISEILAGQGLYSAAETLNLGSSYGLAMSDDSVWIDTLALDIRYAGVGGQWMRDDDSLYIHPVENQDVKVFDDMSTTGIGMRVMSDTAAILGKSGSGDAGYLGSYLMYPVDAGELMVTQKYHFPVYGVSIENGAAVAGYTSQGYGGLFSYGGVGTGTDACAGIYGLDVSGTNCGCFSCK